MQFKNVAVLSTAGVIAALALGAGGAYAANQIGSADIQDGSVRSVDIKDGRVKRADLSEFVNKKLDRRGEQGPRGAAGERGVKGEDAQLNSYVNTAAFTVLDNNIERTTVWCDEGDLAVGGGYRFNDHNNHSLVFQNGMEWSGAAQDAAKANGGDGDDQPDGWHVEVLGGGYDADGDKGDVYVTCLS